MLDRELESKAGLERDEAIVVIQKRQHQDYGLGCWLAGSCSRGKSAILPVLPIPLGLNQMWYLFNQDLNLSGRCLSLHMDTCMHPRCIIFSGTGQDDGGCQLSLLASRIH